MGNTQCSFCSHATNITYYSCKYKKNICSDCIHYIRSCSHCNQWFTKNVIRYTDKLYCIPCINELYNISKYTYKCNMCNCNCSYIITHNSKIYCTDCIDSIYKLNKKLK